MNGRDGHPKSNAIIPSPYVLTWDSKETEMILLNTVREV
jgi:hypothetical protein